MPGAIPSFPRPTASAECSQPLGGLGLLGSIGSAVAADRIVFTDAFAAILAERVAQASLPDPIPA